MSEQITSHEVKGIVRRWSEIVSMHRSGEGYQKVSAALKVPENTVASIILNWKKFGTTKTLPRAGRPAKLSNREKGLGQGGDQEPDGQSDRAVEFLCGDRRTFQKENHLCSTPPIRPFWTPTAPDVTGRQNRSSRTTTTQATACSPHYHPEGEVSTGLSKLGPRD